MISPIGTTITAQWTPKFKRGKVRWNWAALLKRPTIITHVLGVRTTIILNVFVGEMLRLAYLPSGCTQVTVTTKRLLKELALFGLNSSPNSLYVVQPTSAPILSSKSAWQLHHNLVGEPTSHKLVESLRQLVVLPIRQAPLILTVGAPPVCFCVLGPFFLIASHVSGL